MSNPPPYAGSPPLSEQAGYPPPHAGYPPPQGYYPPPAGYHPSQPTNNIVVVGGGGTTTTQTVVVERRGVNHCLHCIISLFFFPWVIVWICLCIQNGC